MHALIPPMNLVCLSENLVNFGLLTLSFAGVFVPCGLHSGLCNAFLVYIILHGTVMSFAEG